MTVQIVGTSELLTIALVKAVMTSPGTPPIRHMSKPAANNTRRASIFLTISTNVRITSMPPTANMINTS